MVKLGTNTYNIFEENTWELNNVSFSNYPLVFQGIISAFFNKISSSFFYFTRQTNTSVYPTNYGHKQATVIKRKEARLKENQADYTIDIAKKSSLADQKRYELYINIISSNKFSNTIIWPWTFNRWSQHLPIWNSKTLSYFVESIFSWI